MAEKIRCKWCVGIDIYEKYHDEEWGVPVYDEQKLFEFLILETFQAGLSWITILRKRENFKLAFDHFDYKKIANYSEDKVQELLGNTGIIRIPDSRNLSSRIKLDHHFTKKRKFPIGF